MNTTKLQAHITNASALACNVILTALPPDQLADAILSLCAALQLVKAELIRLEHQK